MSIGCHISKNSSIIDKKDVGKYKTYLEAIKYETELLNMSAFSIFTVGPRTKNKVAGLAHNDIKKYCEDNNLKLYTHSSYIASGIWNVNKENRHEDKSQMYLRLIRDELLQGKQLGAKGVVVHYPRHPISTIVETMKILSDCKIINAIRENSPVPKFTLEAPASRPHNDLTYETPEKINALIHALKSNKDITIDFDLCIDTCHQYAGGVSFKEANSWHNYANALSKETYDAINLIHLNGAYAKNYQTGKDGHVIPMSKDDAIWSHLISDEFRDYLDRLDFEEINNINLYEKLSKSEITNLKNSSLYDIIKFVKTKDIAMIMEINVGHFNDSKAAMDIINGLLKEC